MQNHESDPIVTEVRAIRAKLSARFGIDIAAIIKHAQTIQETFGRPSVKYPARRLAGTASVERLTEEPRA